MNLLFDFGYGVVPAHRHSSGGGWVGNTACVDATTYVGPNAQVYGDAQVYGNAQVYGDAALKTSPQTVSGVCEWGPITFFPCQDGNNRLVIGCRYFTYKEALDHWQGNHARIKTLELVKIARILKWI